MATEYKLSYTASEIDEKLGKIDSLATTTYVDSKDSEILADAKIYTNDQIASIPAPDVSSDIDAHDSSTTAHADIREQIEQLSSVVASKEQLIPEFANNIEECTDTTKLYVLPDGMIYAYILTEVEAGPSYKNWLTYSVNKDGSDYRGDNGEDGYRKGYRYSSSSAAEKAATGYDCIGFIPVRANDVVRVKNVSNITTSSDPSNYATAYCLGSDFERVGGPTYFSNSDNQITMDNGAYMFTVLNKSAIRWCKMTLMGVTDATIITINEPITEGGGTSIEYAWANTGHAFVPADYEDRIVAVENATAQHTTQIAALEKAVETGGADASEKAAHDRIKNWKYPINEDAPVFLLESDKPAIATSEQNTDAVYAKYDALMNANPGFVSKVNCGMASDGTTPIYVYHFKEAEPHYSGPNWSETKPVILVCSGVHPTEQTGVHSLYYAMEEITTNPKLLDLRRNVHFIVMPMINPTGFTDTTYGVRNPDGIQVHYNFEVDFTYPTDPYYVAHGNRNHGGETPLSIPETQYFDALMDEYKDNLAIVVSCHNNDIDEQYGTGFIWCSCATHFMCNLGFRFADKMSAAWREKHGTAFDEGVRWANEYALAQAAAGSSLFNSTYVKEQPEWDYRVGRASISGSGGTEYKQALKYGVHGINVETCDRCMVLDKDFTKKRTANVTTMGCEAYINFFRTFMAAYDPKDKKDYAPNLPWNE